jgi:general secretion pathway protein G
MKTQWDGKNTSGFRLQASGARGGGSGVGNRAAARFSGRRRGGFTLVELLLVLVILATLAAVVIPMFAGRTEQARVTAAQTQIDSFKTAINTFEVDNGFYPQGNDGLQYLIEEPDNSSNWRGPYLQQETEIPLDPWKNAYIYEYPGKHNARSYDLFSLGPDLRAGTEDDITNWKANK